MIEAMGKTMNKQQFTFSEAGEKDLADVIAFFHQNGLGDADGLVVRWKYLKNPTGNGRLFLAKNESGRIVGLKGYIPREIFSIETGLIGVHEAVDLFFLPEVRGQKLFPRLKKFAMDRTGGPLIAFPNERAQKVTKDMGWRLVGPIDTWFFPISFTGRASGIANTASRAYAHLLLGRDRHVDLKNVSRYDHNYTVAGTSARIGHSASYLNWRFIDHPVQTYSCFEFLEDGESIGYCVLELEDSSVTICDFFATKHTRPCLRKVVEHCRAREVRRLECKCVGLNFWKYGFFKITPKTFLLCHDLPEAKWIAMLGDSDW